MPLSWSPDGREVFFSTNVDGKRIFMLAPLDGSPARQVDNHLSDTRPRMSPDGRRVLCLSAGRREGEHGIWLYDIVQDSAIQVDEGRIPSGTYSGRWSIDGGPGIVTDGERFLYGLTREGRHQLLEADVGGRTRLRWSFPDTGEEPPTVTVHGDRIAFTRNDRQVGSLFLARVGKREERLLLEMPGSLGTRGSSPPTWSPDGRTLSVAYAGPGDEDPERGILLVEVTESGELAGEPRLTMEAAPWG